MREQLPGKAGEPCITGAEQMAPSCIYCHHPSRHLSPPVEDKARDEDGFGAGAEGHGRLLLPRSMGAAAELGQAKGEPPASSQPVARVAGWSRKHLEPSECQERCATALKSSLAHICPLASTTPCLPQRCSPPSAMFSQGLSNALESSTPILAPCTPAGRWYRGRDVACPQREGAPVQAVQEGATVLPQPVEEPGWERCGYLEKLVSEDQGGHGGVEPARVTPRERRSQERMLRSIWIHFPTTN